MSKIYEMLQSNGLKTTVFFILILLLLLVSLNGCGNQVYSGQIGNDYFSFQVSKKAHVIQYVVNSIRYHESQPIVPNQGLALDPLIYLDVYVNNNEFRNARDRVESKITELKNNSRIVIAFGISDINTIVINGIEAEYIDYSYQGYTTKSILYQCKFASFVYKGNIIDINVLTLDNSSSTNETFDLIVNTFKIKESK